MNIQINLVLSADANLLSALQLLTGRNSGTPMPVLVEAPADSNGTEKATEKKTRTRKMDVVPTEPPNLNDKELETVLAEKEKPAEVKTDHTLDSIRAEAVPRSKAGHKTAIKAKITELGYDSLEDMQPEHFNEFYNFLQTFPKP
jgi:hypothetical protein